MSENIRINADFERLGDREDLVDWATRGVYINLGTNPVRTARVGEGWVDNRAASSWIRRDERLIACDLGTDNCSKRDAQILEWLILSEYEYRMDRLPRRNYQRGKSSIVARALSRRDKVRLRIGGYNPLNGRRTSGIIHAEIVFDRDGELMWFWY